MTLFAHLYSPSKWELLLIGKAVLGSKNMHLASPPCYSIWRASLCLPHIALAVSESLPLVDISLHLASRLAFEAFHPPHSLAVRSLCWFFLVSPHLNVSKPQDSNHSSPFCIPSIPPWVISPSLLYIKDAQISLQAQVSRLDSWLVYSTACFREDVKWRGGLCEMCLLDQTWHISHRPLTFPQTCSSQNLTNLSLKAWSPGLLVARVRGLESFSSLFLSPILTKTGFYLQNNGLVKNFVRVFP